MKRKRWLIAVLVVALGAAGVLYWQKADSRQRRPSSQPAFATAKAKRETIESLLSGTASIVFSDRRSVQSSVEGTLSQILVADGSEIKMGQVLAIIENPELADEVEQARTDLSNAQLRIETLRSVTPADQAAADNKVQQAEETLAERLLDLKKLTVTSAVSGRVSSVKVRVGDSVSAGTVIANVLEDTAVYIVAQVAQADIPDVKLGQRADAGLGSALPIAEGTVTSIAVEATSCGKSPTVPVMIRASNPEGVYRAGLTANVTIHTGVTHVGEDHEYKIYATGTVSPISRYDIKALVAGTVESISIKDGDSVEIGGVVAQLTSESLQRAVRYAENNLTIERQSYDRIQQGFAPNVKDSDIRQAETQLKQAEATLQAKLDQVRALQVTAPVDGIIISHSISEGQPVNPGTALFAVADPTKMHMVVPVDELDVMQVKAGQKATITVDAIPNRTFAGTVTKVASEGAVRDGIANYDVTVTLDSTKDLRGSMTGTASILLARKENVLTVPSEAVKSDGRRRYVNVLRNGQPTPVDVTVGLVSGRLTEIIQGLSEGDSVVLSGSTATDSRSTPGGGGVRIPAGPGLIIR